VCVSVSPYWSIKKGFIWFVALIDGYIVLQIGWVNTLENRVREREHINMMCSIC